MEVVDRLHSTLTVQHIEVDLEQREQGVLKSFHEEFTNFLSVLEIKTQISHDANLFSTICQNIKNDLISLDTYINELQKCQQDGKILYIKCTLSYKLIKDIDSQIGGKMSELEALSSQLQHLASKIDDFEGKMVSIHNDINKLELWKEQNLKKISDFRESIALKISMVEKQLEECVKAKDTYSNFLYSDLNAVEIP